MSLLDLPVPAPLLPGSARQVTFSPVDTQLPERKVKRVKVVLEDRMRQVREVLPRQVQWTTNEMAAAIGASPAQTYAALSRLKAHHAVVRVGRCGCWALPTGVAGSNTPKVLQMEDA